MATRINHSENSVFPFQIISTPFFSLPGHCFWGLNLNGFPRIINCTADSRRSGNDVVVGLKQTEACDRFWSLIKPFKSAREAA